MCLLTGTVEFLDDAWDLALLLLTSIAPLMITLLAEDLLFVLFRWCLRKRGTDVSAIVFVLIINIVFFVLRLIYPVLNLFFWITPYILSGYLIYFMIMKFGKMNEKLRQEIVFLITDFILMLGGEIVLVYERTHTTSPIWLGTVGQFLIAETILWFDWCKQLEVIVPAFAMLFIVGVTYIVNYKISLRRKNLA